MLQRLQMQLQAVQATDGTHLLFIKCVERGCTRCLGLGMDASIDAE